MKTRHNPLILAFAILVIPLTCVFAQPAQTDNAKGPQIRFENDLTENIDYSLVLLNIDQMPVSPQAGIQLSFTADFKQFEFYPVVRNDQTQFVLSDLLPGRKYFVRAVSPSSGRGPVVSFSTKHAAGGILIGGVTSTGGINNQGTVFMFDPATGNFSKIHDYSHPDYFVTLTGNLVRTPAGFACYSISDGTGAGELITLNADGDSKVIDSYSAHNGSAVLASDNHLYVVDDWINFFRGGIYRIHSDGDDVNALDRIIFRFKKDEQGINPYAPLLQRGTTLFGTAPYGGSHEAGTIFRLEMDGSGFAILHSFSGSDGHTPSGALIEGEDGFLYGVTQKGGKQNQGSVFRINPDGTGFTTLMSFSEANGAEPVGSLLSYHGRIYGTTSTGGAFGHGVIFSVRPDGKNFRVLHHCDGTTAARPLGGLASSNDGTLYGMTSRGGHSNLGVIYSIKKSGSQFRQIFSFTNETGGSPNGVPLIIPDHSQQPLTNDPVVQFPEHSQPANEVAIYPNPFRESFTATVNADHSDEPLQISISDSRGNVIKSHSGPVNSPVEMGRDLEKGVYVLRIVRGETVTTRKLIKN